MIVKPVQPPDVHFYWPMTHLINNQHSSSFCALANISSVTLLMPLFILATGIWRKIVPHKLPQEI